MFQGFDLSVIKSAPIFYLHGEFGQKTDPSNNIELRITGKLREEREFTIVTTPQQCNKTTPTVVVQNDRVV